MSGATSVLDGVEGVADQHPVAAADLLDRTRELVALRNRIDAELVRTARAADLADAPNRDGLVSMASWLRGHCRLSTAAAFRTVRAGRALEHLPALAAAFAAGQVTAEQVDVIAPIASPAALAEAAAAGVDLAAIDASLAALAATAPHQHLRIAVHAYLAGLDPDGPEPDPTEGRSLTLVKHDDGSLSFRGELDAVGGEKLQAALEAFTQADRTAGDLRTRAQKQADALVQLCDVALACARVPTLRTVKPQVFTTIGLADLTEPGTGPAAGRTDFGAVLSAARVRWAACDGAITRIVLDPDGLPLDLGRTHRVVPPWLRRAVEQRDRACVFAGCDAPKHWCEAHHNLIHWAHGGETVLENLALLCERHHTQVHHGFRVERQPDGAWRTWRPDGTEILVHQDPLDRDPAHAPPADAAA
jgi:hypothetical protein